MQALCFVLPAHLSSPVVSSLMQTGHILSPHCSPPPLTPLSLKPTPPVWYASPPLCSPGQIQRLKPVSAGRGVDATKRLRL